MHAVEGPLRQLRPDLGADGGRRAAGLGAAIRSTRSSFMRTCRRAPKTVEASRTTMFPHEGQTDEVFYGVAASENLAVLNPAAFSLAPLGDPRRAEA